MHKGMEYKIWKYLFLFILTAFVCAITGCGQGKVTAPTYDDTPDPVDEKQAFCIVTNIDQVDGKISLRAVNYVTEYELSYNGGTDVRDKYDNQISMTNLNLGSVVDIVYDANRNKLISLAISGNDKVTMLQEVVGATIDYDANKLKMNYQEYDLGKNVCAFSDNREIGLDEICSEDQLTVWLYNNMVCSVYVDLGHGYVKLSDYETYIGGTVEIGYDVIAPVTEDMLLTVREGTYTLRISKGNDSGTKEVKVVKNQETDVSLSDIAIEPKQIGSVLFEVTPGDAAVYIDGKQVNTEGAVELTYGKHSIYITAPGYGSYSASFNVSYAYKVKKYVLEESNSTTDSTAAKSTTTESTNQSTTGTGGSTTATTTADTTGKKTSNKVTVSKPSGVNVYLDGEYVGVAPISFTKVTGSHIITLSMSGYLSKSYTVTFSDDGVDKSLEYDALTSVASLLE